jgi:hypothetical protein
MRPRSSLLSLVLIVATMAAGLIVRFVPPHLPVLHLPMGVAKYGGSLLWALMLYWIVSTVQPWWNLRRVIYFTGFLATAVELFKLLHTPALDAFRLTIPGILLLGRTFSIWDIAAYWLAVLVGAWIDGWLRPVANR